MKAQLDYLKELEKKKTETRMTGGKSKRPSTLIHLLRTHDWTDLHENKVVTKELQNLSTPLTSIPENGMIVLAKTVL